MTARLLLSHDRYTVGWVCALPIELAAAKAMLDEQHHDLPQDDDDDNTYTLGSIGDHNIVLACLPAGQTGTNSAAAVAMQMKSTFRAIRFGLMVGIGGGVPNAEADIRLGDIVVSQPGKGYGGVIQYDFGKSTPSGIERTGFLNTPPRILLTAISKLRANHDLEKSHILNYTSTLGRLSRFSREQAGEDILFEAVYNHVGGNTCTSCDNTKKLRRRARPVDAPVIHYGTIASGNLVIKDGATRDLISTEFGEVLCFEMEAAGLMNSFPCLVIRGICDYADSHKNKKWQPYAAGTAAAYAKELLLIIPEADVKKTRTVEMQISSGGGSVFIGDRININYITTVRPLARSLYHSLITSSAHQFRLVRDDLARLMTILETITEDSTDSHIDYEKEPAFYKFAQDLHQILGELLVLKEHYDCVGTQTQRTWERQQWRAGELSELRSRLISTTSALNTVYIKLIHSSSKMVMVKLDTFINEVRTGKREGSVVTHHSSGSLSADEKEAWRELRKELETIGITPAHFNQHHDIIVARLQEAIEKGDLTQTLGEQLSDHTERCNSDFAQSFGDRFSSAEDSEVEYLAPADYTGGSVLQPRNPKTDFQPPTVTPASSIRGPSRIAKLLSRITNGGGRLRKAAEKGNEPLVRALLQKGVNVDSKDQYIGTTPLLAAATNGHEAVVRLLLETGKVDVNLVGNNGASPLSQAAAFGHEAVVRLLLETGQADVNSWFGSGLTPLSRAVQNQHGVVIRMLLQTDKVNVNVKNIDGMTLLSWAAQWGHVAIVRRVLETSNVDVDSKDRSGTTPLSRAAQNGNEVVVQLLLETGKADVDFKDVYGITPLSRAAQNGHKAVVQLLLKTGKVDINFRDVHGMTPLSQATKNGHEAVMSLLSQPPTRPPLLI